MRHPVQRTCGLECGASGAKLVALARRDADVVVDDVGVEEEPVAARFHPPARAPLDLARQILLHRDLSGRQAILTADRATGGCFTLLPRMSRPDMAGALLLQARKTLSWQTPDPVMAHLDSEFVRDRTGSIVALGDWAALKPWCRAVEGAGAAVDGATLRVCAYQALARRQRWAEEFPVYLVADIGAVTSIFCVFEGETPKFLREAPVAGDAVTRALMTEVSTDEGTFHLAEGEAEDVKITGDLSRVRKVPPIQTPAHGAPAAADPGRMAKRIDMMIRPVVERISSEIARSIQFYRENTGQTVSGVLLTGGSAGLASLESHVRAALAIPVRKIDPFAGLTFAHSAVEVLARRHADRLGVAVGLALADRPALNLLPRSALAARRLARFAHAAVGVLLALVFVPLVVAGTMDWIRLRSLAPRAERGRAELAQLTVFQQKILALQADVRESSGRLQGLRAAIGREPLWSGVLVALAAAAPADVVLSHVSAQRDAEGRHSLLLKGQVVGSTSAFDASFASLVSALSSSVFFSRVSIVSAEARVSGESTGGFEIRCDLAY